MPALKPLTEINAMSADSEPNLTPLMRQYNEIKRAHSDAILFFRLGDFYEMFGDDAKEASALLNLALTRRATMPMCGIPYHAARNYINRLLKVGKKVAVCEQMTPPGAQKGIVKRDVVEILTPGTVIDDTYLDSGVNNYLVCMARCGIYISLAYIDLSTAEFETEFFLFEERSLKLRRELMRLSPKEILIQNSLSEDPVIRAVFNEEEHCLLTILEDWQFDKKRSFERLTRQFGTVNLKGFGFEDDNPALIACGPLLDYIEQNVKTILPHLHHLSHYSEDAYLGLDESTRRNLELTVNTRDGGQSFTLFSVLNQTRSVSGQRRLHRWVLNPLKEMTAIRSRSVRVAFFAAHTDVTETFRDLLRGCYDLERLVSRIVMGKAVARDLVAVKVSLVNFLSLSEVLSARDTEALFVVPKDLTRTAGQMADLIDRAVEEDPGADIDDGWIRDGFSPDLDRLRSLKNHAREYLNRYLDEEKELSKIPNLRIRENNVVGYFLEVTKSHRDKVPSHFIRRQTLTNAERYTTDRLMKLESEIRSAEEQVSILEKDLFREVCARVADCCEELFSVADTIADWDAFQSLGYTAVLRRYVCPVIDDSSVIDIRNGRHPVVEKALPPGSFVPNDFRLDNESVSFAMITGPNMAGKSTYLRQTALIVLMAQIGSFVPASSARIGVVDKIFCRVGASDYLARGESTFLVEMNETANILRGAGDRSLIIMDEIGRGTATVDGLSIAQAVCENLLVRRIKTVFATHFHELTRLESPAMKNFSLQISEAHGEITFLKKVKEGPCGSSYGIHVARLAGLPSSVIIRAGEILEELQKRAESLRRDNEPVPAQGNLFTPEEIALTSLKSLDLYNRTPLEVVAEVERIQKELLR